MLDYILLKPALKYLEKLPTKEQIRIIEALDNLISKNKKLDIKSLKELASLPKNIQSPIEMFLMN